MSDNHRFTPTHWLILVSLIGGFAMFGLGAWMLYAGIKAEGAIDIKTTLASGTIKAGSAGLFILFFAFMLIVISLLLLIPKVAASGDSKPIHSPSPRSRRLLAPLYAVLCTLLLSATGVAFFPEGARMAFLTASFILTTTVIGLVTAYIRAVAEDEA